MMGGMIMNGTQRASRFAVGACVLWVVPTVAGCKSNVDRAAAMADAVCACADLDCAEREHEKGADEMLKHLPRSLSKDDLGKIEASKKKAMACLDKFYDQKLNEKKSSKASKGDDE
jgi:hypothetical protein